MANPPGRPCYEPKEAHRQIVINLRAINKSLPVIARQLGISVPTLKLYYGEEIEHGQTMLQTELIGLLVESARNGSFAAQRELLARTEMTPMKPERVLKLGKKAQQNKEAREASIGTEWGSILPQPQ